MIIVGQSSKHYHCALAVSNIVNFLSRYVVNVLKCSWDIVFCHLIKSEIPEIFRLRVEQGTAIKITSHIANPNIISLVS